VSDVGRVGDVGAVRPSAVEVGDRLTVSDRTGAARLQASQAPWMPRLVAWLVGNDGDHVGAAFVHVTVRLLELPPPS
jgi:hypothetical protein